MRTSPKETPGPRELYLSLERTLGPVISEYGKHDRQSRQNSLPRFRKTGQLVISVCGKVCENTSRKELEAAANKRSPAVENNSRQSSKKKPNLSGYFDETKRGKKVDKQQIPQHEEEADGVVREAERNKSCPRRSCGSIRAQIHVLTTRLRVTTRGREKLMSAQGQRAGARCAAARSIMSQQFQRRAEG